MQVNKKVFRDELHKTESLRASEITRYTLTQNVTEALFDTSAARRSEGLWGFLKTNVIIFLLAAQAFLLSRDVDNVLVCLVGLKARGESLTLVNCRLGRWTPSRRSFAL